MKKIILLMSFCVLRTFLMAQYDDIPQPVSDNSFHMGEIDNALFNSLKPEEQEVYLQLLDSLSLTPVTICWIESDFLHSTIDERLVGCRVVAVGMNTKTHKFGREDWLINDGGTLPYPQCMVTIRRVRSDETRITLQVYY